MDKVFNPENVAAVPGMSATAQVIEYLSDYLKPEIVEAAEREFKRIWYAEKKKEILFWIQLKKGYEEAIRNAEKRIEMLKQEIRKREEKLLKLNLSVNREKLERQSRKAEAYIKQLQTKISIWKKRLQELQKWVPTDNYKDSVWWKKGFAKEYPSRDRLIQKAIEDYWELRS